LRIERRGPSSRIKRGEKKRRKNKIFTEENKEGAFREKLDQINRKEVKERLDRLFNVIDQQGEKLKKTLDKNDLVEYRKRVREFLRVIQSEFSGASQSFSWDGRGNMKTYTIINRVDRNLGILHDLFIEEQADALKILKRIDEIRGLLLDLYI